MGAAPGCGGSSATAARTACPRLSPAAPVALRRRAGRRPYARSRGERPRDRQWRVSRELMHRWTSFTPNQGGHRCLSNAGHESDLNRLGKDEQRLVATVIVRQSWDDNMSSARLPKQRAAITRLIGG